MTYRYSLCFPLRNPLRSRLRDRAAEPRRGAPEPFPSVVPLLLLGLLLAPGGIANAQDEPRPDSLGESRQDSAVLPLDPIMVTVSRLPLRPSRAGFAVTVVPEVTLRAERAPYALEVLRELPGAFIDEATGPGGPAIVRLRGGEEVFSQILMDGVQVNENGGFFDFQGVTLTNIGQVEVARGPQSALYGSSAVSGVVQFITPPGEQGPLRLGGTVEGGGGIDAGRSFRGNAVARGGTPAVLYSGGVGLAYNRGLYDIAHDTWTRDGSLRLDAHPGDRVELTGIVRFIGVESDHPVRDAGVTRVPLDPNAGLERDRYVVTGRARFDASDRWTHGLTVSAFRQDFLYFDERDDIEQPPEFTVVDADLEFSSDLWRTTIEYLGSYTTARRPEDARMAVAYGATWEREDLHTTLAGDFGDSEADFDRESVAAFADLRGRPHSRLDLMVGARAERYEGLGTEITPRGSLIFHAFPDLLSVRAAAGRAYKVPNLQQQFPDNPFISPNPDLEAETSVSWELGADLGVDRLALAATGFRQDFENLIRTVPGEDDRLQDRNVGESRAWGVEASLRYRVAPTVVSGVEVTRTWTEIIDNEGLPPDQYPEGGTLPFRPELIGSVFVHARVAPGVELVTRATYLGRQVVLTERFSGRREPIDGYVRLDATANYRLTRHGAVYLRAVNLLDTPYDTAYDRPGIPLTLVFGLALDPG
jgi:vitamin B12 transporter